MSPTETRTYRVTYRHDDGSTFTLSVDGHDQADAVAYPVPRAVAIWAAEVPGSRRPLGVQTPDAAR